MAQLAAANVTYSMSEALKGGSPSVPVFSALFNVTFGDGTATYTSGGIPMTKAKLGCPATIREFYIIDQSGAGGVQCTYDHTAETVRMYVRDRHTHPFLLFGGITTADFVYHNTGVIGKVAATNATIAGTAAATTGGVDFAAVAALSEVLTSATVSATTLRVRVVGW